MPGLLSARISWFSDWHVLSEACSGVPGTIGSRRATYADKADPVFHAEFYALSHNFSQQKTASNVSTITTSHCGTACSRRQMFCDWILSIYSPPIIPHLLLRKRKCISPLMWAFFIQDVMSLPAVFKKNYRNEMKTIISVTSSRCVQSCNL